MSFKVSLRQTDSRNRIVNRQMGGFIKYSCVAAAILLFSCRSHETRLQRQEEAISEIAEHFAKTAGDKNLTIAVMPFYFSSDIPESEQGKAKAEELAAALVNTGKFKVIEQSRISQILQQQGKQASGLYETSDSQSIGQLAGAQVIVITRIERNPQGISVISRIVEVSTGIILSAKTLTIDVQARSARTMMH